MANARGFGDWLDERTGWRRAAQAWTDHPAVGGGVWARAIGSAVATCIGILALTGVVLMTAYAPSPQTAWASVAYTQFVQDGGWIIRGVHFWAAQALMVLAVLHVLHGAFAAAYRKPGEIGWWLTLAILGVAMAQGITGGLLPWDQQGWWARVVEGNITGLAPVVGGWLQRSMSGGAELGAIGLSRAFTIHVLVLPAVLLAAVWGRRALALRAAAAQPGRDTVGDRLAPGFLVAAGVTLALLAVTGALHGAPLDAPADPLSDYPARPEWFLMSLFALRKLFHGPMEFWGTTLVPALAAAYLVALPLLDRGTNRARVLAPVVAIFGGAVLLAFSGLRHDARDKAYQKARAKADLLAAAAGKLAVDGVPPAGALEMVRHDPELRGRDLFDHHCASCHVLGDLGDPEKATATNLDGWGTVPWLEAMMHDPDAPAFFGRGPYKGQMPSVDARPKDKPPGEKWTPMVKSDADRHAIAVFLASQADAPPPGDKDKVDPPKDDKEKAADKGKGGDADSAERARGEKIVSDHCTACHLYKGDGDDEGSKVAPELSGYASVAWTRAQVANPSSAETYREKALDAAMKKHMPRFDGDLSPADVDIVARWTQRHARETTFTP
jgi:ubiquinol-cytochrome c reductase cytochrome b subunit